MFFTDTPRFARRKKGDPLPPPFPLGGGLRAGRRASRGEKRGIPVRPRERPIARYIENIHIFSLLLKVYRSGNRLKKNCVTLQASALHVTRTLLALRGQHYRAHSPGIGVINLEIWRHISINHSCFANSRKSAPGWDSQAEPRQARPNQARPNQARPGQARPDQARPE